MQYDDTPRSRERVCQTFDVTREGTSREKEGLWMFWLWGRETNQGSGKVKRWALLLILPP